MVTEFYFVFSFLEISLKASLSANFCHIKKKNQLLSTNNCYPVILCSDYSRTSCNMHIMLLEGHQKSDTSAPQMPVYAFASHSIIILIINPSTLVLGARPINQPVVTMDITSSSILSHDRKFQSMI